MAQMVEGTRTALVVEDEPLVLAVFRTILQRNGFIVLAAETGEAAFHWSYDRALRIDLVVADIRLPGIPGSDMVLQIRTSRPDVPVLLTSGTPPDGWNTMDQRNIAELPKGSYSFLQKPFTAGELMDAVENLLTRKALLLGGVL